MWPLVHFAIRSDRFDFTTPLIAKACQLMLAIPVAAVSIDDAVEVDGTRSLL